MTCRWAGWRVAASGTRPSGCFAPGAHRPVCTTSSCRRARQRKHWFELVGGGGRPEISPRLDEGIALLDGLTSDLQWLSDRLPEPAGVGNLMDLPLEQLRARLATLAARPERVAVLPHVSAALDEVRDAGLGAVVDDLAARGVATESVTAEVEHVWWASLAQEITVRDPAYGAHDGAGLRRDVAEFGAADRAHLSATVERVQGAVARKRARGSH